MYFFVGLQRNYNENYTDMKTYIILITFLISNLALFAQAPKYQTYSADLLIIASKDGENIQWQNKDIVVTLNYKTGALKIIINNNDFLNKQNNENIIDDDSENSEFIFLGNLPIEQVINQKNENQEYDIELQLTNNNFSINEVINFKMNIMRPNQTAES